MNSLFRRRRALVAAALALAVGNAAASGVAFSPIANVQYDWAHTGSDRVESTSEDGFRRARLGFRIKDAGKRWQFVAEHDFADRTPPDAYLEFTPDAGHSLRVGQFKQPFLLEDAVSDKQTALLEASPLGAFAISRRIGVAYGRYAKRGTLDAAVFGQRLDGTSESTGASLRGTWLLHPGADDIAHVGISLASESPDNNAASFSAAPGTVLTPLRIASTGSIAGVDRIDRAALEGVWIRGAWSAQAESARVDVRRDGGDVTGYASSAQLTWSPSGDGRSYKRGVVGAPAAREGAAWELALRWSAIDLDDGTVAGGRGHQLGVGATCYLNEHLRIGANLLRADSTRRGVHDHPTVAAVRVQLTY